MRYLLPHDFLSQVSAVTAHSTVLFGLELFSPRYLATSDAAAWIMLSDHIPIENVLLIGGEILAIQESFRNARFRALQISSLKQIANVSAKAIVIIKRHITPLYPAPCRSPVIPHP